MKDIPGYEGLYSITEDGQVWSHPKKWVSGYNTPNAHPGKFLKLARHTGGYLCVRLVAENGAAKMHYVHRLVAKTYLPAAPRRKEVNHIDGNKTNNHHSNLEWATRKQNSDHAKRLGLYTARRYSQGA